MKYFIDTEFLEGTQTKKVLGFNVKQTKPTIDLISIGIVAEDGREYYAISKDFNLEEAWNRFELKPDIDNGGMKKIYWLRKNVLLPIYIDKIHGDMCNHVPFSYSAMKGILKRFGKSNVQIAEEVKEFVYKPYKISSSIINNFKAFERELFIDPISFYGYYADYDWVVFCWLFGKMIDLPEGFPMYCNDLKQSMDTRGFACNSTTIPLEMWGKDIKEHPSYPKQTNEHNALADARWNKELYEFLKSL